jgi:hypothetical protein
MRSLPLVALGACVYDPSAYEERLAELTAAAPAPTPAPECFDGFLDVDGDGFGSAPHQWCAGDAVTGVSRDGDCDDADPGRHPGAAEVPTDCVDQDCADDAEVVLVPASEPSLQPAVDAACPGSRIVVEPTDVPRTAGFDLTGDGTREGLVVESSDPRVPVRFALTAPIRIDDDTLIGLSLDGGGASRCVEVGPGAGATILQSELARCAGDGGGALYAERASGLRIEATGFVDPVATVWGAAGFFVDTTDVVLKDVEVTGAPSSSAFEFDGVEDVTLERVTVTAVGSTRLHDLSGRATVTGSRFSDNRAGAPYLDGAGLRVEGDGGAELVVEGTTFDANVASGGVGGALYATHLASVTLDGVKGSHDEAGDGAAFAVTYTDAVSVVDPDLTEDGPGAAVYLGEVGDFVLSGGRLSAGDDASGISIGAGVGSFSFVGATIDEPTGLGIVGGVGADVVLEGATFELDHEFARIEGASSIALRDVEHEGSGSVDDLYDLTADTIELSNVRLVDCLANNLIRLTAGSVRVDDLLVLGGSSPASYQAALLISSINAEVSFATFAGWGGNGILLATADSSVLADHVVWDVELEPLHRQTGASGAVTHSVSSVALDGAIDGFQEVLLGTPEVDRATGRLVPGSPGTALGPASCDRAGGGGPCDAGYRGDE